MGMWQRLGNWAPVLFLAGMVVAACAGGNLVPWWVGVAGCAAAVLGAARMTGD